MFSRTTDYALRAIVWLASKPDTAQTTREIALETRIPVGYLAKVMQQLVEAGVVSSQRGLGGGFLLTRRPEKVSVLEVVNAVDPVPRIRHCPLDLESHRKQLCPLHRKLDDALALVEAAFSASSIADLIDPGTRTTPLCPRTDKRSPSLGNLAPRQRGRKPG